MNGQLRNAPSWAKNSDPDLFTKGKEKDDDPF